MSEEVLWYAARVSGLMTWVLACCSLIAGLLLKSQREDSRSPARVWAGDAQQFLGIVSMAFLAVHGAAIVANSLFDVTALAALSGRGPAGWLSAGLVLGSMAGWLLVVVEILRFLEDRLGTAGRVLTSIAASIVVVGGAAHAWSVGSDVRNPFALVVLAVFIIAMLAAASLAFGADDHLTAGDDRGSGPVGRGSLNGSGEARLDQTSAPTPLPRRGPLGGRPTESNPVTSARITPVEVAPATVQAGGEPWTALPDERVVEPAPSARAEIPLPELRRSRQIRRKTAPIPHISGARFVDSGSNLDAGANTGASPNPDADLDADPDREEDSFG